MNSRLRVQRRIIEEKGHGTNQDSEVEFVDLDLLRNLLQKNPEDVLPLAIACPGTKQLSTDVLQPPSMFGVSVTNDEYGVFKSLNVTVNEEETVFGRYVHASCIS